MNNKMKIAGVVTMVALAATITTSVFAVNNTATTAPTTTAGATASEALRGQDMKANIKTAIADLVTKGTITQADADTANNVLDTTTGRGAMDAMPQAVQDALKANMPQGGGRGGRGGEMAVADKAAMDAQLSKTLADLVTKGTITQAQADEANKVITSATGRIDFSTMPQAVQDALKAAMPQKGDRMAQMANLTTEQATAVKTACEAAEAKAVADLVAKGTITQAQADAIIAHQKAADLTTSQLDAVKTAIDTARKDSLTSLADKGTITTEQATTLSQPRGGRDGGMGGKGGMRGGRDGCVAPEATAATTTTNNA